MIQKSLIKSKVWALKQILIVLYVISTERNTGTNHWKKNFQNMKVLHKNVHVTHIPTIMHIFKYYY